MFSCSLQAPMAQTLLGGLLFSVSLFMSVPAAQGTHSKFSWEPSHGTQLQKQWQHGGKQDFCRNLSAGEWVSSDFFFLTSPLHLYERLSWSSPRSHGLAWVGVDVEMKSFFSKNCIPRTTRSSSVVMFGSTTGLEVSGLIILPLRKAKAFFRLWEYMVNSGFSFGP